MKAMVLKGDSLEDVLKQYEKCVNPRWDVLEYQLRSWDGEILSDWKSLNS